VKILGISGWQKSYPTKIALGVNSLQYNYEEGVKQYFNAALFNSVLYSYNGVNYHADGKISNYSPLKADFPVKALLGDVFALDVTVISPFSSFDFNFSLSAEEYTKVIGKGFEALLDVGIKKMPSWIGAEKPNKNSTMLITKIMRNGTSINIYNKNWLKSSDNDIVRYFDVTVPTIKISSCMNCPNKPYFDFKPNPPKLTTSNYKTGAIDIYGGALYKGKWYGKRMISLDFKRKN